MAEQPLDRAALRARYKQDKTELEAARAIDFGKLVYKTGAIRVHEVKIFLLGDSGAGKSSLLNLLQGRSAEIRPTVGIDLRIVGWLDGPWLPGYQARSERPVLLPERLLPATAIVWDFGGQPQFGLTHRLFRDPAAVFVLVIEAREDIVDVNERVRVGRAAAERWRTAAAALGLGQEAEPLLVVTKERSESAHQAWRAALQSISQAVHFVRLEDSSGEPLDNLRLRVALEARKLIETNPTSYRLQRWEMNWWARLQDDCRSVLTLKQVMALWPYELSKKEVRSLLERFHRQSRVIYFPEQGFVCAKPHWLLNVFQKLLQLNRTRKEVFLGPSSEGSPAIFSLHEFTRLLAAPESPESLVLSPVLTC